MVMQIRRAENEGTLLRSNEKKNLGKALNKIEARLASNRSRGTAKALIFWIVQNSFVYAWKQYFQLLN